MLDILFSPAKRFAQLKEKPDWVLPLVLALVVSLLLAGVFSTALPRKTYIADGELRMQKVTAFVEKQLDRAGMSGEKKAEQLKQIEDRGRAQIESLKKMSAIAFFGRALAGGAFLAVWHGILLVIFALLLNFMMPLLGAGGSFKRMLAITANAALVRVVAAVVTGVMMLATGKTVVATSLRLLVENSPAVFLRGLLSCIDVFTIWELALVAFGLKTVFNVGGGKSALAVFGLWLVYVLMVAGLYTMSGGLMAA